MIIAIRFFSRVHAGKLGQVTNFTTVGGSVKHCVDQYMVLFHYCSLGGDTAMPRGLHARLCHASLVYDCFIVVGINESRAIRR